MSKSEFQLSEGRPTPRGVTCDGEGANIAIFSANASRIDFCLFDDRGEKEVERFTLPEYTDEVFHGYIKGIRPGMKYGFRVDGPHEPDAGHRFNPNKLLLDPYAERHFGALQWRPEIFGYRLDHTDKDLSFDDRDSAPFVPKCIVHQTRVPDSRPPRPRVAWDRTIVYEMSVRGFTMRHPAIDEAQRGRLSALRHPEIIRHIKQLGVTSVEWLPVHFYLDDSYLTEKGMRNYWGYNSIGFFSADPRFLGEDDEFEFERAVDAFHDAGLEVILDVVYNHTAEGSELGPTLSFRGIDNASYYKLLPGNYRYYINDTGTGNTFNLSHPRVLQLVMDSLRFWAEVKGVDGFRFDLATILGRLDAGFSEQCGFLTACTQDPVLADIKLIAEPWDCGPGGYQVGGFAPGWAEWNDSFRDTVRDYWRGESGSAPQLANRMMGSADKFNRRGRKPWASVNFITAHDGFTLEDLVSYNEKHNQENGEQNRDGHSHNRSWNCGYEGSTDDPEILALRDRQKRNMLATLFLSQGTPMLLAGDEMARTQRGNNNAYCQDNEISWVDWSLMDSRRGRELYETTQRFIEIRNELALLHRTRFLRAERDQELELNEIRWLSPAGVDLTSDQWNDPRMLCLGVVLDGRARPSNILRAGEDSTLLWIVNSYHDAVEFMLPEIPGGTEWKLLIDTNRGKLVEDIACQSSEHYLVTGRSTLLFCLRTEVSKSLRARNH